MLTSTSAKSHSMTAEQAVSIALSAMAARTRSGCTLPCRLLAAMGFTGHHGWILYLGGPAYRGWSEFWMYDGLGLLDNLTQARTPAPDFKALLSEKGATPLIVANDDAGEMLAFAYDSGMRALRDPRRARRAVQPDSFPSSFDHEARTRRTVWGGQTLNSSEDGVVALINGVAIRLRWQPAGWCSIVYEHGTRAWSLQSRGCFATAGAALESAVIQVLASPLSETWTAHHLAGLGRRGLLPR